MKSSLVALNLIDNNKVLLNPTNYPLLLYWNDFNGRSIPEEIFFNENSSNFIINTCCNIDLYTSSKLSFFYFIDRDNDGDDDYTESTIDIQSLFSLSVLDEDKRSFYKEYLNNIFKYLYYCTYKEDYEINNNPLEWEEDILILYRNIQNKYPKKILKDTVINYVRSELTLKYKLSSGNSDWIIEQLKNILVDEK